MRTKSVALVDDEDVFHWIVKKYVEMMSDPCQFMSFYNGDEIYQYLCSSPSTVPDVLFLDLNMPVCNGWRFLENYSNCSQKKDIDIYILSSSIDPEDKRRADSFGIVKDFISKPLPNHFLDQALKNCG
jgi:CheY-like chemotaxis protein